MKNHEELWENRDIKIDKQIHSTYNLLKGRVSNTDPSILSSKLIPKAQMQSK